MKPSRLLKNCTSENNMPLREMKICTPKLKNFHSDTSIPLAEEHSQKRKRRRRKKIPLKRNVPVDDFDIDPWTYLGNLLTNNLRSNQVEINTDSKTQKTVARLKEPRDLFELPSDLELVPDLARWPSECQVVEEKIHHIEAMPNYQEKYYEVTGKEVQPKPAPDTDGTTVFSYSPVSPVNYFSRSTTRGNLVAPEPSRNGPDLRFESRFESGNLAKAIKMTDSYYQLYLRTDLYTDRHTQWFYFMVENMKKNYTYRFSIVNLCKGKSLYSVGMKPVMYSTKCAIENKLGWHRCGTNITYFRNDNGKEEDDPDNTYTLSFQLEFPHDEDCVFLAHSYPYTYSNLQQYLIKLQNNPTKSLHTSLKPLCKTLAGNNVYLLTITEPPDEDDQPKKKKGIVITARVHPGETPSSYMMKGLIDFLTGDSKAAKELRGRFIFKVVPMLNPDGVIVGNSRCSLSGRDLNRQYRTVIRETYPPVCYTKLMIRRMMDTYGVAMYCDFHAHSSKHSVFIYGCENKRSQEKRLQEQIFPLMLHKNSSDKFSFENCKFRVQKNKEGTGRVVMWMLGIENSYTLEASFAGSTLGLKSCIHFNTHDYEAMGRSFCETLLDFIDDSPIKIPLMTLNLESGDCQSSGDEKSHQSFQQSKLEPTTAMEQAKVTSRVDSILMPPELVITSTQGNDLSVFERLYKCAQQPKEISHSPTKKDICQKCSPRRTKSSVSPSDGKEETTQRSHIYLRHQYWKVFSNGNVSWQSNINDHEELLKACSDKLAELKKKHKLRKIKYAEKAVMSVPKLFTESQRLKRKSRSFTIGRSYSFREHCVLSFEEEKVIKKKDSSPEENKEEIIKKNKVKSKKFRKGGLVSLAAVQKKRENDAHTVLEKQETLPGKKKKKKKKLTQLQKRVKNAVQTVGIVTGRKSGKH